ncbi:methyltransferase, TIGR04325 family [Flavobacteriaceae bacterium]|nr:methyltransferase, TIGR04325 family [Flavobacteriaceae bacterium]
MHLLYKILNKLFSINRVLITKQALSWDHALKNSHNYNQDKLVNNIFLSTQNVLKKKYKYESDGINFNNLNIDHNFLESLKKCIKTDNTILLDFGGSLGTTFFKYHDLISKNKLIEWFIIEQEKIFEKSKILNFPINLKFFKNIDEIQVKPDIILLGSVLQYIEHHNKLLTKLISLKPNYVFIERTIFSINNLEPIYIQENYFNFKKTSYPVRAISLKLLIKFMLKANYIVVNKYENKDIIAGDNVKVNSILFKKKSNEK